MGRRRGKGGKGKDGKEKRDIFAHYGGYGEKSLNRSHNQKQATAARESQVTSDQSRPPGAITSVNESELGSLKPSSTPQPSHDPHNDAPTRPNPYQGRNQANPEPSQPPQDIRAQVANMPEKDQQAIKEVSNVFARYGRPQSQEQQQTPEKAPDQEHD